MDIIGEKEAELAKILIVEDEEPVSLMVAEALKKDKHVVDLVTNGEDALLYLAEGSYDLLIVDCGLPKMDGVEVCRLYRSKGGSSPVLFLTGRTKIEQKIDGLESGADDYVTKPFDMRELTARVKALLRRPQSIASKTITVRDITLDPHTFSVTKDGQEVVLYPKEFALLELFMRHPKEVFSPDSLLMRLWPSGDDATLDALRQTMLRLRAKIETEGQKPLIVTIRGVGYRLEP